MSIGNVKNCGVPISSFTLANGNENSGNRGYSKGPRKKSKDKSNKNKLIRISSSKSVIFYGENEGLLLRYSASSPSIVSKTIFPSIFLIAVLCFIFLKLSFKSPQKH